MSINMLQVNNRIDVLDIEKKKWREARVIFIKYECPGLVEAIQVHFKGLSKKYDEWIHHAEFEHRIKSVQEGEKKGSHHSKHQEASQ